MTAGTGAKLEVRILWPDARAVSIDQIRRWASDDLANEEGRSVDWRSISPAQAIGIVDYYGSVTFARLPAGLGGREYQAGDQIEGPACP